MHRGRPQASQAYFDVVDRRQTASLAWSFRLVVAFVDRVTCPVDLATGGLQGWKRGAGADSSRVQAIQATRFVIPLRRCRYRPWDGSESIRIHLLGCRWFLVRDEEAVLKVACGSSVDRSLIDRVVQIEWSVADVAKYNTR